MVTWESVPKPEKRKNGREWNRVDKQSQLSPSNPKIPSWPKIPSFVDTPKCPAWRNPLALGHGTAWDHYQMENFLHPTLKYPAAPKIPSSVDATKYPAWSLFVDIPWLLGHGTAWDHYKIDFFSILPQNTQLPQKYPALSTQQNTQLGVFLSTSLGFWDIGQHGTTIKWKTISIPPKKNTQLPQNTQLRRYQSFCRHPLAFGTWDSMGPMENYQKISLGLCVSIPWLWDVRG